MHPDKLITTLEAGQVTRYHSAPTVPPQTVAQHSWGVATILQYLIGPCSPNAKVLKEALGHDVGEYFTGDIPAPLKWAHPEVGAACEKSEIGFRDTETVWPHERTLNDFGQVVVKMADMLEGMWWCDTHEQPWRGGKKVVHGRWGEAIKGFIDKCANLFANGPASEAQQDVFARAVLLYKKFGGDYYHPLCKLEQRGYQMLHEGVDSEGPTPAYVNQ